MKHTIISAVVVALASSTALAQFTETEANDSKAAANAFAGLAAGSTIRGNSTATTGVGLDYFDLTIGAAPLGIYRHRLVITTAGTAGHTGTIRGLSQNAAPADTLAGVPWDGVVGTAGTGDNTAQTSSTTSTPPRFNQWYGFGKQERFYYRVNGGTTTTADYIATMETVPVVPVNIGSFQPGQISITTFNQGHTTDTDMWVYDANLNAIAGYGNDDESPLGGTPGTGASLQSWLSRNYAPGTYYLALTNFAFQNNMLSPSDDDFRTGTVMDFANLAVNSSTTANLNMTFTITDSAGSLQVPNTKAGVYDINWFSFTVLPEPASMSLFALGLLAFRRRRA